jgi:hypothetical protein
MRLSCTNQNRFKNEKNTLTNIHELQMPIKIVIFNINIIITSILIILK